MSYIATYKLEAYDYSGNVIGTIIGVSNSAPVIHGSPDAFSTIVPDLAALPHRLDPSTYPAPTPHGHALAAGRDD